MTKQYLWQPWITIKGASGSTATIVQPAKDWLDRGKTDDTVIRIDMKDSSMSVPLQIDTGPSAAGPWTSFWSWSGSATKTTVVFSADPDATNKGQRYIRWSINPSGAGSAWSVTFQITSDCKPRQPEAVAYDDGTEVQPWTTVVGGIACTGDNIVVPGEDRWVDTEGLEQLVIKVQTIECLSATLVVEKAMSPEGPWTSVLNVGTTGVASAILSTEYGAGATYMMERYVRWHVESNMSSWKTCFRINAQGYR
jgi:hypothetical protein